jgi:hypothetical protein
MLPRKKEKGENLSMLQDYNQTLNLPKTEFPMRASLRGARAGYAENVAGEKRSMKR